MDLLSIRHLWGIIEPYNIAFKQIKKEGYAGVEIALHLLSEPKSKLIELLKEFDLKFIPLIKTTGNTVKEHVSSFASLIKEVSSINPLLINAHSGRDAFNRKEAMEFYKQAINIENDLGIPVAHETHRSRTFFNPWITRDILLEIPELKICSDYSHWVNVCERLIDDEIDILQLCAERCLHLHARVGYEEGPQVPDPRAPEYQRHVEAHERWWDMIWDAQIKSGRKYSTLTPEFGPSLYLHTLPYTNVPVASLEEICYWQMQRQIQRFKVHTGINSVG